MPVASTAISSSRTPVPSHNRTFLGGDVDRTKIVVRLRLVPMRLDQWLYHGRCAVGQCLMVGCRFAALHPCHIVGITVEKRLQLHRHVGCVDAAGF